MRDMNFFAPFLATRRGRKQGGLMKFLLALVVLLIVLTPIGLFGMTYMAQTRTEEIKEILKTPENVAVMKALGEKQARLDAINRVMPELNGRDQALTELEWFDEELLQVVVDTLPKQVRMTDMNLLQVEAATDQKPAVSGIEIRGVATDRPAIAELEHNMRATGRFSRIFVSTLDDNEGTLYFTVKFNVKDVNP